MAGLEHFREHGWVKFDFDPELARWAQTARGPALAVARDPVWRRDWMRHGDTWFVGVHALPNDADGAIEGTPLAGRAVDFARARVGQAFEWDKAQISICYRGYPRPWEGESDAAHRYRVKRDAAHVDGLHRGPSGARLLQEYHRFLLGVPLGHPPPGAAPFVVWDGSHRVMQAMFAEAYAGVAPEKWHEIDVAEVYSVARKEVFAQCARIELPVRKGEATVIHRHALHGMAPWPEALDGPTEGRIVCYFRPEGQMDRAGWLALG